MWNAALVSGRKTTRNQSIAAILSWSREPERKVRRRVEACCAAVASLHLVAGPGPAVGAIGLFRHIQQLFLRFARFQGRRRRADAAKAPLSSRPAAWLLITRKKWLFLGRDQTSFFLLTADVTLHLPDWGRNMEKRCTSSSWFRVAQ